jgi:hypothetical protein
MSFFTKSRIVACAIVAAFVLGSVPPAVAVPFVFPDRADFIVAFPNSPIEDWDSFPDGMLFPNGSTFGGITYASSSRGSVATDQFAPSSGSNGIGGTPLEFFAPTDTMTFGFDKPLNAFGIDINTDAGLPGAFTATTNTGETAPSVLFAFPGLTTGQFIGFSTGLPFTSVTIAGQDGFSYTLDTLRYSPVPEPGSLLLIGAGLAGLAARRHRHRQNSKS